MNRSLQINRWGSIHSIRMKMIAGLFLIVLPLIGFLIYMNGYAIDVVRNQVAASSKDLLTLYRDQVDARLVEADNYLIGLMQDPDLSNIDFSPQPEDRIFASQRIASNLTNSILRYPVLDGLFVYIPSDDQYLYSFRDRSTMIDRMYIKSYISDNVSKNSDLRMITQKRMWYVQKNGDRVYLLRFFVLDNDSIVGAWTNAESLQTPLDLLGIGEEGAALLGDGRGNAIVNQGFVSEHGITIEPQAESYYLTGSTEKFLAVGEDSREGEFSLHAFIPEDLMLQHLSTYKLISYSLPFVAVLILAAALLLLRKTLLLPLNRLLKVMNRIQQGNLDTQIKDYPTSLEFQIVNDTFNNMMEQIKHLRISVYEEQLNKQKAELQHLQLQIRPHFFINTLNMMYMLARTKDVTRMEEMSLCLVRYFRYMFQSNLSFVTLKDELQHIRNYLRIQELRYPDQLTYEIEAPSFLLSTPVPPLIVHTFVENAIKHAMTMDEQLSLSVTIEMLETPQAALHIEIRDNGPGFSPAVVESIDRGERIVDDEGDHIGIWNVKRRLQLIYGERTQVVLRDGERCGAVVDVTIPLSPRNDKEKDKLDPGGMD
ncbi:histidine kinase [Paenibacillus algorifonticola]|uniref:sensor histidine kinase n=1 Tax=Paenibacillus algorifonticola TaxID=684063 RepID=UPI003D2A2040